MCTTEREKTFGKQNHREEMHMRTNFYLDGVIRQIIWNRFRHFIWLQFRPQIA